MKMVRIRQTFPRPVESDIRGAVRREMARLQLTEKLEKGSRVCLTAGSRGIANIALILAEAIAFLHELDMEPFAVAAMGSHGGGTVEGQRHVLANLGITEESLGAPLFVGEETVVVGKAPSGHTVYCDAYAARADALLVVNRVKLHTTFRGELESGLFKMMAVGLGKRLGAESFHRLGVNEMAD